jgi:hypothetical protein
MHPEYVTTFYLSQDRKRREDRLITKRRDEKPGVPPNFSSPTFAINVQSNEKKPR